MKKCIKASALPLFLIISLLTASCGTLYQGGEAGLPFTIIPIVDKEETAAEKASNEHMSSEELSVKLNEYHELHEICLDEYYIKLKLALELNKLDDKVKIIRLNDIAKESLSKLLRLQKEDISDISVSRDIAFMIESYQELISFNESFLSDDHSKISYKVIAKMPMVKWIKSRSFYQTAIDCAKDNKLDTYLYDAQIFHLTMVVGLVEGDINQLKAYLKTHPKAIEEFGVPTAIKDYAQEYCAQKKNSQGNICPP